MSNYEESSFVLTLPMNTTDFHIISFDKIFEVSRKIQNACLREILKTDRLVLFNWCTLGNNRLCNRYSIKRID